MFLQIHVNDLLNDGREERSREGMVRSIDPSGWLVWW